jgi:hypothetical protein
MLFGETVAVYCENRTEHTNTLCEHNFLSSKYRSNVCPILQTTQGLSRDPYRDFCSNKRQKVSRPVTLTGTLVIPCEPCRVFCSIQWTSQELLCHPVHLWQSMHGAGDMEPVTI